MASLCKPAILEPLLIDFVEDLVDILMEWPESNGKNANVSLLVFLFSGVSKLIVVTLNVKRS